MEQRLRANAEKSGCDIGISITAQKAELEEEHGRIPDLRAAAEQRQNHLGVHRLDGEKQRRAEQKCDQKERDVIFHALCHTP